MIELVTGVPGMGKTALVVDRLRQMAGSRPIYVDGIRELKVEHFPVPHFDTWVQKRVTETGRVEFDWVGFPQGALIVIDECQRMFPPRHVSKEAPDIVSGFQTHRHAGLDFILLTQDATFLDSQVRKVVDKHTHIQDSWIGRFSYTWMKEGDPKLRTSLDQASRKKYSIPKAAYPLYKSADVHTERKRAMPLIVPLGGLALIAFIVLAYRVISSVSGRNETLKATATVAEDKGGKRVVSFAQWRIVGVVESPNFRLVLSDGRHQRVVQPLSFKRYGATALEANLEGGEVVTSWAFLDAKKGK